MRIVALHTDFRIYWPARLNALYKHLSLRGHVLDVIEIAGKGSHYSFVGGQPSFPSFWHVLFPERAPEELSGSEIKKVLFPKLYELKPDVIIAGAIAFPSGALAVDWGQKMNKPIIIFDDAKIEIVKRNALVNCIKRAVYSGVDAIFYPSQDWIPTGEFWGFRKEQLFFGVDVVDNQQWEQGDTTDIINANYFVAVGRQIPDKNFYSIVKAYHQYRQQVGNELLKLVMVGDGPEHQAIVDYISQHHLENDVISFPFLSQAVLSGLYKNARALCLCSKKETWGLVINEAMACGCPIIASVECGATNVLVSEGKNGFKFSSNDIQALADIMTKLHSLTPDQLLLMRKSSKEIISGWGLERFSTGCYDAIQFVSKRPKRKTSFINKFIISLWKGRYRPI